MINAPRGTNDIIPPESTKWNYIEKKAKYIFDLYNYDEIRTPIFEYTELFQRGIGEVTDIVEKEMYTFEDKSGRSITLRPEGTASVVRSFLENKIYGQAQPTKYYYIGPMFRYERPQAGRYRQFNQLGIEVFGTKHPMVDAEVIAVGMHYMDLLGLKDLTLYINSIGCPECRPQYLEKLKTYLKENKEDLCVDCKHRIDKNPLRVLDCKNESCQGVISNAPKIIDNLCNECEVHFDKLQQNLDDIDIEFEIDPNLVRGLDYYTKTAFEVKYEGLGAQDTIFGGGRYDKLAEEIGDKDIPGIGFALGIERLLLTIEKQDIEIPVDNSIDIYLTTIGGKAKKASFELLNKFRKNGIKAEIDYLQRSVGGQMKSADRMNATYTVIIGENELNSGKATVRNMKNGEEQEIELDKLVESIEKLI
ncbi:MAG TPA: histidine--tRNA ligase [Halanaerobiales bacterium]|nr:histidine--tRNA ligase [Halanaerobiales bacterium]